MAAETYSFARYLNVRSAYAPSFAPDGKRLSFLSDITGVAEVWSVLIHSIERVSTPLFVVHGANDPRVPVGEAEQVVAALNKRNVPVEYLRFEDEGHGLVKRANRLQAYPAIARFLDKHVRNKV